MKVISIFALLLFSFSLTMLKAMEDEEYRRALEESKVLAELQATEDKELEAALKASRVSEEGEQEPREAEEEESAGEFEQLPLEQLPAELHAHIAQFLGNTVRETLRNIINFAQVNKALYNSLLADRDAIKNIIVQKFHKRPIAEAFLTALSTSTKLDQIRPFFEFNLVTTDDVALLNEINPQWLKKLLLAIGIKKLVEKLESGHFTRKQNKVMSRYRSKQSNRFLEELITYLISKGIIKLNQAYSGKTPLYWATKSHMMPLFLFLQTLGADVNDPINQRAVEKARTLGWSI